jgi:excisionase family DNA binding protein
MSEQAATAVLSDPPVKAEPLVSEDLPPADVQPLLVDFPTAARLLGVGKSLLYAMHADGRLGPVPITSFGRRSLLRTAELKAWVAGGCEPRRRWLARRGAGGHE